MTTKGGQQGRPTSSLENPHRLTRPGRVEPRREEPRPSGSHAPQRTSWDALLPGSDAHPGHAALLPVVVINVTGGGAAPNQRSLPVESAKCLQAETTAALPLKDGGGPGSERRQGSAVRGRAGGSAPLAAAAILWKRTSHRGPPAGGDHRYRLACPPRREGRKMPVKKKISWRWQQRVEDGGLKKCKISRYRRPLPFSLFFLLQDRERRPARLGPRRGGDPSDTPGWQAPDREHLPGSTSCWVVCRAAEGLLRVCFRRLCVPGGWGRRVPPVL